jgi:N-methylhydantoinase A
LASIGPVLANDGKLAPVSESPNNSMLVGVDTGGTFTDFTVLDATGRVRVHKVLSTPDSPERAILQGLEDLGLSSDAIRLLHGSTVATNALLEGKGARVAYITNRGLADVLTIGRQNRSRLYELSPEPQSPPVPEDLCLETGGRLAADGSTVEDLSETDLQRLRAEIDALRPQAVAINLLFSFLDDDFERRVADALPDDLFVTRSSAVLADIGEYERGIATWLNAYVGPLMARYLSRLAEALPRARVAVMQSSGLTVSARQAAAHGVHLLLSGPAGGLAGALGMARQSGIERLMTLDVGGTSTDVALLDGRIQITSEGRIGRFPVAVPMVDMHTIGAGGGSIARVDEQGLLHVGPESAGADPGPACYGQGGRTPTVTDANLILGRIPDGAGLGESLHLDRTLAEDSMTDLAEAMGMDVASAAAGVVRLANEHMAGALRVISVERGHDPRTYALCCFGGAGGLHACELAELLDMTQVLIPGHAGVLSALGMLYSPPGREGTRAILKPIQSVDDRQVDEQLASLGDELLAQLGAEGLQSEAISIQRSVDLRYLGQSFSLTVPWRGCSETTSAFHRLHKERYGHRLDNPVELVSLRIRAAGPTPSVPARPESDRARDQPPNLILDRQSQ